MAGVERNAADEYTTPVLPSAGSRQNGATSSKTSPNSQEPAATATKRRPYHRKPTRDDENIKCRRKIAVSVFVIVKIVGIMMTTIKIGVIMLYSRISQGENKRGAETEAKTSSKRQRQSSTGRDRRHKRRSKRSSSSSSSSSSDDEQDTRQKSRASVSSASKNKQQDKNNPGRNEVSLEIYLQHLVKGADNDDFIRHYMLTHFMYPFKMQKKRSRRETELEKSNIEAELNFCFNILKSEQDTAIKSKNQPITSCWNNADLMKLAKKVIAKEKFPLLTMSKASAIALSGKAYSDCAYEINATRALSDDEMTGSSYSGSGDDNASSSSGQE